jgi:methyl-accepting chemotaxis protein
VNVIPALYGLKAMNGEAVISANVSIVNVSHSLTVDPYYQGFQNATIFTVAILSTMPYNNATFKAIDIFQNLTVVGLGYAGYLNNLEITGTMSITDPIYNLTDNFAYSMCISKLPFFNSAPYYYNSSYFNFTFVSGDVPIYYNESSTTFYGFVASPIENLTLTPLASFTLAVNIYAYNYSSTYEIKGLFNAKYVTPFSSANNSVLEFSSEGLGQATVTAYAQNSYITLQGSANGVTFTTNAIDVLNSGPIPVSGLTTGQYGSGTLTGTLNIAKLYPYNSSNPFYPSQVVLYGQLTLQGFYANGTQYYTTVNLMNTVAGQSLYMALTSPMTAEFTTTLYSEMANTGMSSPITYPLLNGSGAMIVRISDQQIAEIATLTGQYVNMSIAQLNAHINSVWSTENATYAEVSTDYGNMVTMLNSINSKIIAINNTVATIQTSLGTIQTSLNNLNAKIVALSGTVATIQTNIGTIQTSLSSINSTVTSTASSVNSLVGSVATIQTSLGTIQADVSSIRTTTSSTSSSVSSTLGWEIGVLVLVIITLVLVLIVILQVNRMSRQFKPKEEKKTPEEKKEGQ